MAYFGWYITTSGHLTGYVDSSATMSSQKKVTGIKERLATVVCLHFHPMAEGGFIHVCGCQFVSVRGSHRQSERVKGG